MVNTTTNDEVIAQRGNLPPVLSCRMVARCNDSTDLIDWSLSASSSEMTQLLLASSVAMIENPLVSSNIFTFAQKAFSTHWMHVERRIGMFSCADESNSGYSDIFRNIRTYDRDGWTYDSEDQ